MKSTVNVIEPIYKKKYPCLMKTRDGEIILVEGEKPTCDGKLFKGTVVYCEQSDNENTEVGYWSFAWRNLVPFHGTVTLSSED